jgi:hypothetical protein
VGYCEVRRVLRHQRLHERRKRLVARDAAGGVVRAEVRRRLLVGGHDVVVYAAPPYRSSFGLAATTPPWTEHVVL